jgi:transcriptional regulator with XRE-family HTH domain
MPRKPSNPHVLRTARTILGFTQRRLAQRVGKAVITIQKIESGQIKPSRKLANRLSIETGVDPKQLMENFEPETPYVVMAHPEMLTLEKFKTRKKLTLNETTVPAIEREVDILAKSIRQMLMASVEKKCLWVVCYALRQAFEDLRNEFALKLKAEKPDLAKMRKAETARRRERQSLSPGSDSGGRKFAAPQHAPSVRQFQPRA